MSDRMKDIFESFNNLNVLVIGDVMIDSYLWGKVERISPEAPVPVLSVTQKEDRLGGAANVALNLQAMGANPIICSVIGSDLQGELLIRLLQEKGISSEGIIAIPNRITTVKTRAIGHHQHILRIDEEISDDITEKETKTLSNRIIDLINTQKIDAIIFEDYDKGVITNLLIESVISEAIKNAIPVIVDPKKRNFLNYKQATLIKPNLKELKEGLKVDFDHKNSNELSMVARRLKDTLEANIVMITLSEHGVFVMDDKNEYHIPAHVRNISDVSGAGDTVISVASLGIAKKLPTPFFAALANLAGGLVCEKVGVVPIDKKQLLKEAYLLDDSLELH